MLVVIPVFRRSDGYGHGLGPLMAVIVEDRVPMIVPVIAVRNSPINGAGAVLHQRVVSQREGLTEEEESQKQKALDLPPGCQAERVRTTSHGGIVRHDLESVK